MKATSKRSIELYKTLTNKQKAAVFVQLAVTQDSDEADRLLSQVERRIYETPHAEYLHWRERFFAVSQIWASMYWRQLYLEAVPIAAISYGEDEDDMEGRAERAMRRVVSLQNVLTELCRRHGLDRAAMVRLAGVPWREVEGVEADSDYQAEKLAELEECLPQV